MIEHLSDFLEQGADQLLEQFRDKPRLLAYLNAVLRPIQKFEDDVWAVILSRLIDDAIGVQLDILGKIVGEPRGSHVDDEIYRLFIRARIAINHTHGHADDVIGVLRLVEAAEFSFSEYYPATILIEYVAVTAAPATVLFELANEARAAGVALLLTYGTQTDFFSFCAGLTPIADSVHGFAPTDLSSGGYISGVVG